MGKILSIIILSLLSMKVVASDAFELNSEGKRTVTIQMTANSNKRFGIKHLLTDKINGFSINGRLTRFSKNYLVRVILKDVTGNEHLVLESYKEINNKENIIFNNYCEETAHLNEINADSIIIIVKGASFILEKMNYVSKKSFKLSNYTGISIINDRFKQINEIVQQINEYNTTHDKLWKAGVTSLSLKKYAEKKRILGFDDDICTGGMEYYAGGVFEIGEEDDFISREETNSPYVLFFDWRNQHGKNWITPNKDQGDSGYCHFFTCAACVETMANLYYNRLLNFDLSEQELACCTGFSNPYYFGVPYDTINLQKPLDYAMIHGICDEVAYPFVDDPLQTTCRSSEITPNDLVKISGYKRVDNNNEDSLKKALINHGPLISGWRFWGYNPDSSTFSKNHAMLVVGYGILQEGDTIFHYVESNGYGNGAFTARPGHPCIGKTYWIYKNSYGLSQDEAHQGYMHIIHYNYSRSFNYTYYCKAPIITSNYSDNDILCSDEDGDGYYYWGIDSIPDYCPSWVPNIRDGNDNDASLGTMNEYGYIDELNPQNNTVYTISTSDTILTRTSLDSNIRILSNGTLTISNILNLFGHVTITIESNGKLIIDGGVITNVLINFAPGSTLEIKNGGKLIMRTNCAFNAPIGAIVKINHGEICNSTDF